MSKPNTPAQIFETRFLRQGEDECWGFKGPHGQSGYPVVWIKGKLRKASHIALEMSGHPRPHAKAIACHSCDNPRCVNPRHLRWGTHKDNMQDRLERTGYHRLIGADNHNWVRTPDVVAKVLAASGLSSRSAAKACGVSTPTVLRIWHDHGVKVDSAGPPKAAQARLLSYLMSQGDEWVCIPVSHMAKELGMAGPNVHRALHELVRAGKVQKNTPRPKAVARWRVT